MKPIVTIKTAKNAWNILKKANLHHFLDASALYAIQKISEAQLSLSDIISDLLENDILIEFMTAITESTCFRADDGSQTPWEDVPMSVIGELISSFFTAFISTFKLLGSS
ncbi:MAG TPA: hypothetical protein P5533_01485 [Candidatus Cloacimonadota bacterium]|nr:hypothetical protein [Candidatus Cloacimonadota bacterium]